MRLKKLSALLYFSGLLAVIAVCAWQTSVNPGSGPKPGGDSLPATLHVFLDSNFKAIENYNALQLTRDSADGSLADMAWRNGVIADSMDKLQKFIVNSALDKFGKIPAERRLDTILSACREFEALGKEKREIIPIRIGDCQKKISQLDTQLQGGHNKYMIYETKLDTLLKQMPQSGVLHLGVGNYRWFICRRGENTLRVHYPKNKPSTLGEISSSLPKGEEAMMITNGGMFMPGYAPQGLLIEDGKKYKDLDTLHPEHSNQNFYLLPNAVFYMTPDGEGHVMETQQYRTLVEGKKQPQWATQSGPMLLKDNRINRNFRAGSSNENIRSGVGVIDADRIVFVISDSRVNLFDFSLVFKELFRCKNALYLDGAISQMYLEDKTKGEMIPGGAFGPIISVTKKKAK